MSENTAIARTDENGLSQLAMVPKSLSELNKFCVFLAKSGLIPDHLRGKPADIFVVCLQGIDLGMTMMQSINGIDCIKGKSALKAETMVALVRRSSVCEYWRCVETTDEIATIEAKRRGSDPVRLSFTIKQAQNAGYSGGSWSKTPAAMLRHRCETNMARMEFSDVIGGYRTTDEVLEDAEPAPRLEPGEQLPVIESRSAAPVVTSTVDVDWENEDI